MRAGVVLVMLLFGARVSAQPSLSLADAIRMARTQHPAVQAQRGQVAITRARNEQALARLLPSLTGSFGYLPQTPNLPLTPSFERSLVSSSGVDTAINRAGVPTLFNCRTPGTGNCVEAPIPATSWALQSFWSMQIGLAWTLWDWGVSLYGLRGAHQLAASAVIGVHTTERDVALDAKLAFFAALTADEALTVAHQAVSTYQAQLNQTRAFHDAGLRTGIDVATAESALAAAVIALTRAVSNRDVARAQLAAALGEAQGQAWTLVEEPHAFDFGPEDARRAGAADDALTGVAKKQRTELTQLTLQERSWVSAAHAARGQYLPQLTLDVGPSWAGVDITSPTGNLTIAVALGYPVNGMSPLAVHGQVREAEGNLAVTVAQERLVLDGIRQEVATGRAQLAAAGEELRSTVALVTAADRQRALAEGRYQTGVGNIIELYDALLTDVNARFLMVQAHLDLASARARLQHALGEDD